jgi:hypothetical protein
MERSVFDQDVYDTELRWVATLERNNIFRQSKQRACCCVNRTLKTSRTCFQIAEIVTASRTSMSHSCSIDKQFWSSQHSQFWTVNALQHSVIILDSYELTAFPYNFGQLQIYNTPLQFWTVTNLQHSLIILESYELTTLPYNFGQLQFAELSWASLYCRRSSEWERLQFMGARDLLFKATRKS